MPDGFEKFTGDDYRELTPGLRSFTDGEDIDIGVVRQDGDVIGGAVMGHYADYSKLNYIEVDPIHRGAEIDGQSLAGAIADYTLNFVPEDCSVYAQSTNMDGKTQHLLQDRGFEFAGLNFDKNKSSIEEHASGGFNAELWKLTEDEEIEAYLPEGVQDFVDTSLRNQREVTHRQPDKSLIPTGSINIESNNGKTVKSDITEGSTMHYHIDDALTVLGDHDDWAEIVDIDVTEPVAYGLSQELLNRGYSPVNMTPEAAGNRLRMAKIHDKVGRYSFTSESMEVVDASGLDYSVLEENPLSTKVIVET